MSQWIPEFLLESWIAWIELALGSAAQLSLLTGVSGQKMSTYISFLGSSQWDPVTQVPSKLGELSGTCKQECIDYF